MAIFEAVLWPDGLECPFCGSHRIERKKNGKPMPYRCRDCREQSSIKSATIMIDSKLELDTWLRSIYFVTSRRHTTQPVRVADLAEYLGVDEKTASDVIARLNQVAASMFSDSLHETCELDVTEMRGKRQNRKGAASGMKRGIIKFLGVKGRDSGEMRLSVIERYTKDTVRAFAKRWVGNGEDLHNDAHPSHRNIPDVNQHTVNHSRQFVNRDDANAHTCFIDAEWPILHRALRHVLRSSHLPLHLAGYSGRRSLRKLTHRERIDAVIFGMKGLHWCREWEPLDKPTSGQLPLRLEPVRYVCRRCQDIARRREKAQARRAAKQRGGDLIGGGMDP